LIFHDVELAIKLIFLHHKDTIIKRKRKSIAILVQNRYVAV
jgi:hypothetical protein